MIVTIVIFTSFERLMFSFRLAAHVFSLLHLPCVFSDLCRSLDSFRAIAWYAARQHTILNNTADLYVRPSKSCRRLDTGESGASRPPRYIFLAWLAQKLHGLHYPGSIFAEKVNQCPFLASTLLRDHATESVHVQYSHTAPRQNTHTLTLLDRLLYLAGTSQHTPVVLAGVVQLHFASNDQNPDPALLPGAQDLGLSVSQSAKGSPSRSTLPTFAGRGVCASVSVTLLIAFLLKRVELASCVTLLLFLGPVCVGCCFSSSFGFLAPTRRIL